MDFNKLSDLLVSEGIVDSPLKMIRSVGGGCINECYQVQVGAVYYFLKVNSASKYPGMFVAESSGLQLLKNGTTLTIPEVIYQTEIDGLAYLLMEFIHAGKQEDKFWERFGHGLAGLHQNSQEYFGLDHSNYIGSLHQKNDRRDSWAAFFLECRLIPQLEMGINDGWAQSAYFRAAENLCQVIEDEFPQESPALLHGDLWSGNYMTGHHGQPVLVDPAVYFGNREVDLAFSKMFGGFSPEFYDHYHQTWPLAEDFEKRVDIHNLYPLIVHANLFGGHYVQQVMQSLGRFG